MKKSSLKKKLFIAGANLLILLALLIYVSYSAYRISIAAQVEMLEAAEMRASINMTYDLTTGPVTDPANTEGYPSSQLVLDELVPGEKAQTYADDPAVAVQNGREVTFTVINKASSSEISEVPTEFKLVIEETGPLPLEVIVKNESGQEVGRAYTDSSYGYDAPKEGRFYETPENPDDPTAEKKECVFSLSSNETESQRTLKLYFGWNNDISTAYVDSNRREVSIIKVKAEVIQLPVEVKEKPGLTTVPHGASDMSVYRKSTEPDDEVKEPQE